MGARDAIARLLTGIKAYHSSPHDFERFDLSKIGTGEGAQVYGHGIYAAENPAVSGQGGQYWDQFSRRFEGPEKEAASYLKAQQFDRQKAIEALRTELADEAGKNYPDFARRQETLRMLESGAPVGPRTYEVNINADPAQMLDWDKRIGQQPPAVQKYFQNQIDQFGPDAAMGAQIKIAGSRAGGLRPVSEGLAQEGIPGIKYLDEGSRISSPGQIQAIRENIAHREALLAERPGDPTNTKWLAEYQDMLKRAENPTSNYVVFDPANIDILRKYGIAGAAAAPVVGAAMGSTYDQNQYEAPP
jgi:hypothetical protein